MNEKSLLEALQHNFFNKLEKPYWIEAGVLLGIVRDGKPIEHDNDLDIGILARSDDPEFQNFLKFNTNIATTWRGLVMEAHVPTDGLGIDLWIYYSDLLESQIVNVGSFGMLAPQSTIVLPTINFFWKDLILKFPSNPKAYLEFTYGLSWITPETKKAPWTLNHPNITNISEVRHLEITGLSKQENLIKNFEAEITWLENRLNEITQSRTWLYTEKLRHSAAFMKNIALSVKKFSRNARKG